MNCGNKKINILSFFSGSGFLDLGFEDTGFNIVYVNEYFKPFLDAYRYARSALSYPEPEFGYFNGSIEECLNGKENETIRTIVTKLHKRKELVGFIGGPPCPDFSVAGKNRGHIGDKGRLTKVYIELICEQKPDFFFFENVKGLVRTIKHRAFYEEMKAKLNKAGYLFTEKLNNSLLYGVPQDRERILLFGVHKSILSSSESMQKFNWNQFTKKVNNEIIPEDITVKYWFNKNDVENHPNQAHVFKPRAALEKFKTIVEGDVSKKSFKRLSRYKWSPTAAYGNNEVHVHPTESRRITVAEALSIQSLPKNFYLPNNMTLTNMFKTIGNGVPYLMALGVSKNIRNFLEKEIYESNSRKSS